MKTIIYVYYETDGDSGAYGIKLFSTKEKAEEYKKKKNDAYGRISEKELD